MKVVIQEEETGCGIASVANIVNRPYAEVKTTANAIGIFADDDALFSDTQYVRDLLKEYNIKATYNEKPFILWEALPDLALLSIKHYVENECPFWHWAVFKRDQGKPAVLDSSPSLEENIRTDFENMAPEWFIEIL